LDSQFKKFHFQELDWIVCFPDCGNTGKYMSYTVMFKNRKKGASEPEKRVSLGDLLESPEFENHYPHTVGFYKDSSGDGAEFKPSYLELRIIRMVEDFWLFLNSLDI
jgi:hypothetical protein